ncbi:HEPN domain-containing protein [Enterobacter hormaechei]|uniref:HEPN domain-containing protein n=1 Tax=Enterobacter hormaechei TaxID=158836 RepID=UPI003C2EAA97
MGSVKRYIEQMEAEESMYDWIRDRVDLGVEPGDPEWEEQKTKYLSGEAFENEWEFEDYDYELDRLTEYQQAYDQFDIQMSTLRAELPQIPSESALKMTYSYSVTLMETCLGDMIKSLVLTDECYLKNSIENVTELKNIKIPLQEIFRNNDIVKKVVLTTFSDYLYHNIEKIVPIYSAVLGEKTPSNVKNKMEDVIKITKIRHDIVHRNGVDKDGEAVELSRQVLIKAMDDITEFVTHIKISIDAVERNKLDEFEF